MLVKLVVISVVVFVFNIPFGYWRANVDKFSLQWALAVHIPVPFIIFLRIFSDIGFAWYTYIFLVGSFFLGHRMGAYILNRNKEHCESTSSNMLMDLVRCKKVK
ncbi:MAG: hypothetical protein KAH10_08175 [Flavobacteriales bacterium]|nr:hypothetical protein [Flavobacteriales bacterium]